MMKLLDVYPLFDIEPIKALGCFIWDSKGEKYLDLYGGHAVISVGHSHPHYVKMISEQLVKIPFYSNSVLNSLQRELAQKLGEISSYSDYNLFLCNSGAEAIENALKLASFYTGKSKMIAFKNGFHGRTSGALSITDNSAIKAPVNFSNPVTFLDLNDLAGFQKVAEKGEISAVVIEGIQGIGGIYTPQPEFLKAVEVLCRENEIVLILDEIQSGYGRSGKFFAHQLAGIRPDLITVAKGMGNGFPVAGVLVHPKFPEKHGSLGTTFGGSHSACAAGIAVLDIIRAEGLIKNAGQLGNWLMAELKNFNHKIKEIRGAGLMIGIEFDFPCADLRKELLYTHKIFTGGSSNAATLRLLPPFSLKEAEAVIFLQALEKVLKIF